VEHTQHIVTRTAEPTVSSFDYTGNCLLSIFICYPLALPSHTSSVNFIPPKSRPKNRHWSSSQHNDKLKKHSSNGPKHKRRRRRPPPILMYMVGEALTLQRKGLTCCGCGNAKDSLMSNPLLLLLLECEMQQDCVFPCT